jgi:putative transposase
MPHSLRDARGWYDRGYLPHLDATEIIQFVTFRLADSLPSAVARGLKRQQDVWTSLEAHLDTGHGACWLRQPEVAAIVERSFLHFDGIRYNTLAWCVMPNHVHALIETLNGHRLGAIVQSWKSFTAKEANRVLGRMGDFWWPDFFDRYMRNGEQLSATIDYIENNPVKAGLVAQSIDWPWSSARRRAADPSTCEPRVYPF